MIDLIADVGESFGAYTMGRDSDILDSLTSANVACGFHAGDPMTMEKTVAACRDRGVQIGAHPGFRDLVGFGRRAIEMSADEVRTDVLYQLGALDAFVRAIGAELAHVTPHGRLGNLVVTEPGYATAVLDAVVAFDPGLVVVAQEGELTRQAGERGVPTARMGMVDRGYNDDGTLVSRRLPGAVLHDPAVIAERAVRMVSDGVVTSVNGVEVPVSCDTLLLHGDNEASVTAARLVRSALEQAGVEVAPLVDVLRAG